MENARDTVADLLLDSVGETDVPNKQRVMEYVVNVSFLIEGTDPETGD